jgi:phosphopantothenoylcysteine decarboxylase/phosphopantothenate--cysteine ligase
MQESSISPSPLAGRHLVLGLSGGIACYKAAELCRALVKAGATVQVVMTEAATRFVGPPTFQALTGQPVFTDQWDPRIGNGMAHIELSRRADAIVIAPASADFLAKLANGLADDLLSTLCLARSRPLLVAPAMNREMWAQAPTRRNIARLRDDGVHLLGPASGEQACGETGEGRMLEPEQIAEDIVAHFVPQRLAGVSALITAGPTFEPIDPVRGITNLSSGKMGFAIARACRQAGAQVTLVAGPTPLPTPRGVHRVDVRTARQMHQAVIDQLDAPGPRTGLFVAVAAVADWRVANASSSKLKKTPDGQPPVLQFAQNPDILAEVAARPAAPYCVGFAAESEDLARNGQEKRARKGVPLLVANIGHETFGQDDNELLLIDAEGQQRLPRASKQALAAQLVAEIAQRLAAPTAP